MLLCNTAVTTSRPTTPLTRACSVQLLIQLLNFLMLFMLFFGTYLFQVGLIGELVKEFRGTLYIMPAYTVTYAGYAACRLVRVVAVFACACWLPSTQHLPHPPTAPMSTCAVIHGGRWPVERRAVGHPRVCVCVHLPKIRCVAAVCCLPLTPLHSALTTPTHPPTTLQWRSCTTSPYCAPPCGWARRSGTSAARGCRGLGLAL